VGILDCFFMCVGILLVCILGLEDDGLSGTLSASLW
jgi:hypothetical protein